MSDINQNNPQPETQTQPGTETQNAQNAEAPSAPAIPTTQPEKEDDVTTQTERDRQRAVAKGMPLSEEAREEAIEEQKARMSIPNVNAEEQHETEVTQIEEAIADVSPSFSAAPTALLADTATIFRPEMRLQLIVPLIRTLDEDAEVEATATGEDDVDYSLRNPIAMPKPDRDTGALYELISGLVGYSAEFNDSDFFCLGDSMQEEIILSIIAERFMQGLDVSPSVEPEAFLSNTGYMPICNSAVSKFGGSVVTSLVVPMPILVDKPETMAKNAVRIPNILSKIIDDSNVGVELVFIANPMDFLQSPELIETVNALSAEGFDIRSLDEIVGDIQSDSSEWSEDLDADDDDFEDSDELDSDEDEDEAEAESEDEEVEDYEDDEDESDEESSDDTNSFTLPSDAETFISGLDANGLANAGNVFISKVIN